jgi:hypothetical protein
MTRKLVSSPNGDAYDQALWFFEGWTSTRAAYRGSMRVFYYWLQSQGQAIPYEAVWEAATLARSLGLVDAAASDPEDEEETW